MGARTFNAEELNQLRVRDGFSLSTVDPDGTPNFAGDREAGELALEQGLENLGELQERLYAASRSGSAKDSVLLVLQGMDTAGKGGIVRHVVGGMDPQGVTITGFQQPTREELAHDFLWRIEKRLPQHGFIGVFDRSHYEDVLVGKVRNLASKTEIERRYGAINDFEKRVTQTGTRIVKVMLHISYEKQHDRLAERLSNAEKYWKYQPSDIDARLLWPEYMQAYQDMLVRTSTEIAPWFVVPANSKWYARLAVQEILLETLEDMNLEWPSAHFDVEVEKQRLADSNNIQLG